MDTCNFGGLGIGHIHTEPRGEGKTRTKLVLLKGNRSPLGVAQPDHSGKPNSNPWGGWMGLKNSMKGGRAIDCLFRSLERNVFQKVTPLPIFSGLSSRNYFSYRILRTYWYGNLLLQKSSTKIDY
jgi:hypothetical protein